MFQNIRKFVPKWTLALAGLSLAGSASTTASIALADPTCTTPAPAGQLDPECINDVGAPICFQTPRSVPGLYGMPVWPAASGIACTVSTTCPGYAVADGVPTVECLGGYCVDRTATRSEVSDPRWSNSPLRPLKVTPVPTDYNDQARYRILVDQEQNPTELAVSIQVRSMTNVPTTRDFAYFGIATGNGNSAWGIRVSLATTTTGAHVPAAASQISYYEYNGGTWTGGKGFPATPWIKSNLISVWNTPSAELSDLNGAVIAVQFKLDLQVLAALKRQTAKVMVGMDADFGVSNAATIGRQKYFTPNLDRCTGSDGLTGGYTACAYGATPAGASVNPFLATPAQWTSVSLVGGPCSGINLERQQISTTRVCKEGTRTNCVSALAGDTNTFRASPDVPESWAQQNPQLLLESGWVIGTFKMSNWGTVASPSQWVTLASARNATPRSNDLKANPISANCSNTAAGRVCNQGITVDYVDPNFHQCLLAELSAAPAAKDKISFQNASQYINTRFERASEINVSAQVNIRGIVDEAPTKVTRDVYLHLVAHNMPSPSATPITLDTSALRALRAQADPGFKTTDYCSHKTDLCYPTGDGLGLCAYPWNGCAEREAVIALPGATYYCARQETCRVPAGGGLNKNQSSRTADQALSAEYPTVEVFPSYDSGKTVTVDGRTVPRLVPMPTFSIHAWHEGPFYGWTKGLLDSNGNALPEVYPGVYKIAVNKATGLANIRVRVVAEETRPSTNFGVVLGTATPAGWNLGNATISGVSQGRVLDLSKTSISISKLLNDNGKELVTNMGGPITLTRLPGALPGAAAFSRLGVPTVTMQVVNLPAGQAISIQVTLANVVRPVVCPNWFGATNIVTALTMNDGNGAPVTVRGSDKWNCVPTQLLKF